MWLECKVWKAEILEGRTIPHDSKVFIYTRKQLFGVKNCEDRLPAGLSIWMLIHSLLLKFLTRHNFRMVFDLQESYRRLCHFSRIWGKAINLAWSIRPRILHSQCILICYQNNLHSIISDQDHHLVLHGLKLKALRIQATNIVGITLEIHPSWMKNSK